ncbi:MAG: GNAT family N-acetyltransferase [Mogibacterium sp.]|nr:GNAT family N-acetyltransferase [Mogibacterium sp.]
MMTLPFSHKLINGKGEPIVIDFRKAVPEDIDKVMALQNEIVEALPDKDLYATFSREESLGQLEHDICIMAECNGEVAGYSVMIPNDPDNPENYGKYFDYDREQLAKTVSMDLTMVSPKYRGNGIQRVFNKLRLGIATEMGASEALTTISPDNPFSYRNFLVLNFDIVDERELYGGKRRYILRKTF